MRTLLRIVMVWALGACIPDAPATVPPADAGDRREAGTISDGGTAADAGDALDAGPITDARRVADAGADAGDAPDGAGEQDSLAAHRDRLLATVEGTPCETWAAFDESQRAVFLTLTHRLFISATPDGSNALAHLMRVHLVLGGGADGTECGGSENNRMFLSMDDALWAWMNQAWDGMDVIGDGAGSHWLHTRDIAGPHDPFDRSIETDVGLRCTLLIERSDSRPPTCQGHFFAEGSAVPVMRGPGIQLPADPRMLEVDHDFDCIHRSNPTCRQFDERYTEHYGDFGCDWVPRGCVPVGTGCYRASDGP